MNDPSGTAGLDDELDLDAEAALLVDSLSPAEAGRLAVLLEEARATQTVDVHAALDGMVAAIPPGVRGRVRKVLHGGRR
ncbi:MAG: hypothetical protein ACRDO0_09625 [Nocardioidaceae bacterium]